jgi:hypothetical protein
MSTERDQITVSVNLAGLSAGSYSTSVAIAIVGAKGRTNQSTLPVTLTVTSSTSSSATTSSPVISLSPPSLTFTGIVGNSNPAIQSFTVSNSGTGTLSWTVGDNATWLAVSPASGTNTGTVSANVSLSGLSAGTYSGTITVTAVGSSNSPRTIPVTLTVAAPTTGTATLSWSANTETDLVGYKVYRATASGAYGAPIATLGGATTSYVAPGLQTGTTYFFVVTAYDAAGNESPFSNEVSKSIY